MIGAVAAGAKKRAGAGAPAGTDPATVSGRTLILIENTGLTVNTTPNPDTVSAWADQSGAGNNFANAT
jgi:hypothetical protein